MQPSIKFVKQSHVIFVGFFCTHSWYNNINIGSIGLIGDTTVQDIQYSYFLAKIIIFCTVLSILNKFGLQILCLSIIQSFVFVLIFQFLIVN